MLKQKYYAAENVSASYLNKRLAFLQLDRFQFSKRGEPVPVNPYRIHRAKNRRQKGQVPVNYRPVFEGYDQWRAGAQAAALRSSAMCIAYSTTTDTPAIETGVCLFEEGTFTDCWRAMAIGAASWMTILCYSPTAAIAEQLSQQQQKNFARPDSFDNADADYRLKRSADALKKSRKLTPLVTKETIVVSDRWTG